MRRFWALGVWHSRPSADLLFGDRMVVQAASVAELRCEGRDDPLGIDVAQPRLSWTIESQRRGERQSAYQILVAASARSPRPRRGRSLGQRQGRFLAELWRRVCRQAVDFADCAASGRSAFGTATGRPRPGAQPPAGRWACLSRSDWKAAWIGYDAAYRPSPQEANDDAVLNTRGLSWVHMPAAKAKPDVFEFSLRKQIEIPPAESSAGRSRSCMPIISVRSRSTRRRWAAARGGKRRRGSISPSQFHPGTNVVALTVENTDFLPAAVIGQVVVQFEIGRRPEVRHQQHVAGVPKAVRRLGKGGFQGRPMGRRRDVRTALPGERPR